MRVFDYRPTCCSQGDQQRPVSDRERRSNREMLGASYVSPSPWTPGSRSKHALVPSRVTRAMRQDSAKQTMLSCVSQFLKTGGEYVHETGIDIHFRSVH